MRRLILMRHAKSSWDDPTVRDLDRPLAKRGRRGAALVGKWLARKGYRPEAALVSAARRTQETWDRVVREAGAAPTRYLPEIYHAGPEALLEVLRAAPDVETVLMLGHQPGIGAFAQRLLAVPSDDPRFGKFASGATAVILFDEGRWADVGWGTGRLADFVEPKQFE
ncbi:MAG: histidine phosphatase family protein [Amaricoccus sp.]